MCEAANNSPVTGTVRDQTFMAVIQTHHLHFTYAAIERKCLPHGLGGWMAPGTLLLGGLWPCKHLGLGILLSGCLLHLYKVLTKQADLPLEESRKCKRSWNGFWGCLERVKCIPHSCSNLPGMTFIPWSAFVQREPDFLLHLLVHTCLQQAKADLNLLYG